MKRSFLIGLSLLLALAACTSRITSVELRYDSSPELSAIDSQMWRQPDSAFVLLQEFATSPKADSLDAFGGHYFQLLLSELLYKNDYVQTNRTELLQAVAYFDSLTLTLNDKHHTLLRHCGLPPFKGVLEGRGIQSPQSPHRNDNLVFLDARAHYINGVGFYERDSVMEACGEYIKALEMLEGHFEEKELIGEKARLMALTCTHITDLFSNFYLHDQTIYFGKKSLNYYREYDASPRHVAWVMDEIGAQYEMKDLLDSASFYYKAGISILSDTNNLTYRDLVTHIVFCSYKNGEKVFSSLNRLYNMIDCAESEKEQLSRYLTLGEIYYHEKQLDSARAYLSYVYEGTKSVDSKKFAAERLAEICEIEDNLSDANEYARFLVPYATENEVQSDLKSQLTELCHKYEQNRQEVIHQNRVMKLLEWSKLVFVIVVLFVSIFVLVSKKRRKTLKAQKEETEEELRKTIHKHIKELERKDIELNMAISEERQKAEYNLKAREIQHLAVLGKAKNTIEHLQEINKKLNEQETETEHPKATIENYDALMREGLCVNIRQRLKKADAYASFDVKDYSSLALSSKELSELIQVIDRHCPDFSRRLKKEYPNLNSNDIQLCRLYLLNLKVLQVAILLATDYSSVRKRTNRLKEKIGSEEIHLQLKSTFFEAN